MLNPRKLSRTEILVSDQVLAEFFRSLEQEGQCIKDICEASGVYDRTLYAWRSGKSSPRFHMIRAFAQAAGYEIKIEKIEA